MAARRKDALLEILALAAHDRDASWHVSLLAALEGVSEGQARWRPGPGRNSIWDLVRHVSHWKRALMAAWDQDGIDSGDWSRRDWDELPAGDAAWGADLDELARVSELLASRLAVADEKLLDLELPGFRGSVARNALQVATHDAYHAGQVRLLLRLQEQD